MSTPLAPQAVDLAVRLGPIELEHPLLDASGTFDLLEYARRYEGDFFAVFPFAAYVPKTVTADARTGNPPPRVTETPAGMINAIGLENPGVDVFVQRLGEWARLRQPVIVSVGGNSPPQYAAVVRAVEAAPRRRAARQRAAHRGLRAQRLLPQRQRRPADRRRRDRHDGRRRRRRAPRRAASCWPSSRPT